MMFSPLKPALQGHAPIDLLWLAMGSVPMAEFAAHAAPGAVVLDLQHGLWERGTLEAAIAAVGARAPVIARCADKDKFLAGVVGRNVGALKGKVVANEKVTLGAAKHSGRDVRVEVPEGKRLYRARAYLVGNRLYQVVVLGPEEFAVGGLMQVPCIERNTMGGGEGDQRGAPGGAARRRHAPRPAGPRDRDDAPDRPRHAGQVQGNVEGRPSGQRRQLLRPARLLARRRYS